MQFAIVEIFLGLITLVWFIKEIFSSLHIINKQSFTSVTLFLYCSFREIMLETVTSRLSVTTLFVNLIIDCAILFWSLSKGRSFGPCMKNYMTRFPFMNVRTDIVIHAIYFLSEKRTDNHFVYFLSGKRTDITILFIFYLEKELT